MPNGLTEAFRLLWQSREEFLSRPDETGRPMPGVTAELDSDGELSVRSVGIADGYLDEEFMGADARDGHGFEAEVVHAAINDGAHGPGNDEHANI